MNDLVPVILDFDGTVTDIAANEWVVDLTDQQEAIRFGCSRQSFRALQNKVMAQLPEAYGCVFMGSGDYHHVTQMLLQQLPQAQDIQLIVCDNHPDNMRYPFGIHCGSWVNWASRLPQVKQIHVIGICSGDIGLKHAWENNLSPFIRQKLHYWSIGVNANWLSVIGRGQYSHVFANADALMQAFLASMSDLPVYLSIDKDVLSTEVVKTNWDQGQFMDTHLFDLIEACRGQLIGCDVTGDISEYQYQSLFKRLLSGLDGQNEISMAEVAEWQQAQNALNRRLLAALHEALAATRL